MFRIEVLPDHCKGCGLCIAACPKELLAYSEELNARGVHFVVCTNNELCGGCQNCAVVCPEAGIRIVRLDRGEAPEPEPAAGRVTE